MNSQITTPLHEIRVFEYPNLYEFLDWSAELGITDSPIELEQSSDSSKRSCLGKSLSVSDFPNAGGRGLAAVRDLHKGELILRVPKSALMTTENMMNNDHKLCQVVENHSSLSSNQILTIALLNEICKGKSSLWYPYLVQLPRSYDTLARFGHFEKQALQVDDAIWTVERAILKAELEWKNANPAMLEVIVKPNLLAFKAWLWASATISSRTLHVPWDSAGCLCPVGDLFNYDAPKEDSMSPLSVNLKESTEESETDPGESNSLRLTDGGYDEYFGAYCFYARKNYKTGDQVLLSYGTYTNLELLEHYGFILADNPNDKAYIPLLPEMLSLCSWPRDSIYIHQNGEPSYALLSTVRIWATPASQRKSVCHLAYSGSQVSKENETIVMKWIVNSCLVVLKNLVTSVEEDEMLLESISKDRDLKDLVDDEKLGMGLKNEICKFLEMDAEKRRRLVDRWRLVVEWRIKYKKIFADCVSYCSKGDCILEMRGMYSQLSA